MCDYVILRKTMKFDYSDAYMIFGI